MPPPVFVCSVEATSPSAQKALDSALASLHREDPSFTLTTDEETGQTLLSGMGELHLEILQHRLLNHYRVPIEIGRIRISYRYKYINKFNFIVARMVHTKNSIIGARYPFRLAERSSAAMKSQGVNRPLN